MKKYLVLYGVAARLLPLQAAVPFPDPAEALPLGMGETLTVPLPVSPAPPLHSFARLPLSFVHNDGQADAATKFLVQGCGYWLSLEQTEAVMVLCGRATEDARRPGAPTDVERSAISSHNAKAPEGWRTPRPGGELTSQAHLLRMKLVDAQTNATVTGEDLLPGKFNYFIGNDPALWRRNVPSFAKVRYHEVYPGIDLVYYGNEGQLEYDLVVKPGADPNRIAFSIEGADRIELDDRGDLRLSVAGCELCWHKPKLFQQIDDTRLEIAGEYSLYPPTAGKEMPEPCYVTFQVVPYDRTHALVIDPVLSYSTFLGGGISEYAFGVAVDSSGCAYVTGATYSRVSYNGTPATGNPFPTTTNAIKRTFSLIAAAFVTKFNPAGDQILYSTVLCGNSPTSQESRGTGIVVDASGQVVIAGGTSAPDFPRKNALQPTFGGGYSDAFVTKLSPDGASLVFSTYLGGRGSEALNYGDSRIAQDRDSNLYVALYTTSPNLPVTNSVQPVYGGQGGWYLVKMDSGGTKRLYATYLGGSGQAATPALAVDSTGRAYLAGAVTTSTGFAGALARFSPSGDTVEFASAGLTNMWPSAIAVDEVEAIYLTGSTLSDALPTTANALQPTLAGNTDAFVAKLNPARSGFDYLTYLGGTAGEGGTCIVVDQGGNAYMAGKTTSADFPTIDAIQAENKNPQLVPDFDGNHGNAFVSKISPNGRSLLWSTYLGGSYYSTYNGVWDEAASLTLDSTGALYVAGRTASTDFPVLNAFQGDLDTTGSDQPLDAFVAKIVEPLPPSLRIAVVGNAVSISWPVSAEGFHLESSISVGSAVNWTGESSPPSVAGDQNVVMIEIGEGSKFFRLRKQ